MNGVQHLREQALHFAGSGAAMNFLGCDISNRDVGVCPIEQRRENSRVSTRHLLCVPGMNGGVVMKLRKFISVLTLTLLVGGGAIGLQGCFEAGPPAYGYGYGGPAYTGPAYSGPAYYPAHPVYSGPTAVYGDWDERHVWHNSDWWVANRRPWVQQHHSEWLAHNTVHHEEHVRD
jgi:hypothetical protein